MNRGAVLQKVEQHLAKIYDGDNNYLGKVEEVFKEFEKENWDKIEKPSEKSSYLITYGDSIYEEGKPTLETLHKFAKKQLAGVITDIHILPMFTYTSDDGFSVVDYYEVDKNLGNWNNLDSLSKDFRLMYDFVANHISKSSPWFKGFLDGDEKYKDYFVREDKNFDTSIVIRPRTSPLYHEYQGKNGRERVWTTFSEDQIDVNPKDIGCLCDLTRVILSYALRGASSIRLDAIGFLWKESKTTCMHLPETHEIIKMWRTILDYFKPNIQIITETNVPHLENISYFGAGDEANQVYQFTLPPLTLYSFIKGDATKLSEWAKTISLEKPNTTYFNFLSSHDGIGMRPTEGILTPAEKELLVERALKNGGKVNYKSNPDGSKTPYELNIVYHDALVDGEVGEVEEVKLQKVMAAHTILLSVVGVPAIYYHSLFGSQNDYEGLEKSGINRRINREKLEYNKLTSELENNSWRKTIFNKTKDLLKLRGEEKAFSPYAKQHVLTKDKQLFVIERGEGEDKVTCVINVSDQELNYGDYFEPAFDIIGGKEVQENDKIASYQALWLKSC